MDNDNNQLVIYAAPSVLSQQCNRRSNWVLILLAFLQSAEIQFHCICAHVTKSIMRCHQEHNSCVIAGASTKSLSISSPGLGVLSACLILGK